MDQHFSRVRLVKYYPQALIVVSTVLSVVWTAALFWLALSLIKA